MSNSHEQLVERAKDAIEKVFSDTSVGQQQTLESLDEILDEIDARREALMADLSKD